MANYFQLNLVLFGDRAGLGAYEVGHFLQHQQYLQILAGQGNLTVPDYNILHMASDEEGFSESEFAWWLSQHQAIHLALSRVANTSAADLSYLDPKSRDSWEIWQEAHRAEHRLLDAHFGTT